jgi:adenylate cyclase 2
MIKGLLSFFKVICLSLFFVACNLFGLFHRYLTDEHQMKTYQNTMRCIEARLRLESEKEQQETLILSVIPAHIGRLNYFDCYSLYVCILF